MQITITKEQEHYISQQLRSGNFQNTNEVIADALRLHEFNKKANEELRAEITIGWNSATSKKSILGILKEKQSVKL